MADVNRMRLGSFEFTIDFGSFRRITQSWSGPGWDFNFSGAYARNTFGELACPFDRIGVYCEAAPLPIIKAADYTSVEINLPGKFDEVTGEPYFAIDVGESFDLSDVHLRFVERDHGRYLIELSGIASPMVLGYPEEFKLLAWADELPDHAYPT